MQLYDVATHTERDTDLLKVVHEKHQSGEGGMSLRCFTNELSKSLPAKNNGRGNKTPMWPAQSREPKLQSNGPRSFHYRTVSFGQVTVKTLKDMILNVIVIEIVPR